MPELPEVESIRRGLTRAHLRAPVERVWRSRLELRTGAHWRRRNEHVRRLEGCAGARVRRRGKFLVWEFSCPGSKRSELGLVIHLGMSGACLVADRDEPWAAHTHFVLGFGDGREMRFVDPRRFGALHVGELAGLAEWGPLRELGPEPFSSAFNGPALARRLAQSDRALRDVLLDQTIVAGVGNIYVSEALFRAGLHPLVGARRLRETAWERLVRATVDVLRAAITNGGTTLRDYRTVDGASGGNRQALWVYGRAGTSCRRCGSMLRGYVHQGRSGVFCPAEQRRPRTRWID